MHRGPVALVVHQASLTYVRPIVADIKARLTSQFGGEPLYRECVDVSAADVPASTLVFLVGDAFPRFARQRGCRYVFVNFSLLYRLRWWRPIPREAREWIRARRHAFFARSDLYDMVLDFHPRQTRRLERDAAARHLLVRHFMTGVAPPADGRSSGGPMAERRWDVCLVGTESPRRATLRARLEERGVRVSPFVADDLDRVIRDSRIVANVHVFACDTLEAPRVVHAMTAGTSLVTEPCYGLDAMVPRDCYVSVPYRRLADSIERLLRNLARLEEIGGRAAAYMRSSYASRAADSWRTNLHEAMTL